MAVEVTVPLFKVFMAPEASERVKTVLESGFITQGPVAVSYTHLTLPTILRV